MTHTTKSKVPPSTPLFPVNRDVALENRLANALQELSRRVREDELKFKEVLQATAEFSAEWSEQLLLELTNADDKVAPYYLKLNAAMDRALSNIRNCMAPDFEGLFKQLMESE